MVPSKRSENGKLRVNAGVITVLMIMLPWSSMTIDVNDKISSLDDNFEGRSSGTRSWGEVGYNDTGWIELSATGADPTNGTPAYGNLMLDFAPGAVIDNLTLEVSVNGSDGYWMEQPQMALLNTQTGIFDWSERGGFGRQNDFFDGSTGIVDGVLDTSLQPNSNSDASWQIPTGIEITDLVIEALRPVDPKLSLTPLEVNIHDSAVNPIDGRLYLLVDEDLLHLDDTANKRIIDFTPSVEGRSLVTDGNRGILYIGDISGNVSAMRLNDSAAIIDLPSDVIQNNSEPIVTMTVDSFGTVWAVTDCLLNYLLPIQGSNWESLEYCTSEENEKPVKALAVGRQIFLATENHGVRSIEYNISTNGSDVGIIIEENTAWGIDDFLSSNSIVDIEMTNNILYIATEDSGINRYDLSSSSWLSSWTSSNWLTSNNIVDMSVTPGWLHILSENIVQAYDTDVLLFRSEISLTDFDLSGAGDIIIPWPSGKDRSPSSSMAIIGDSTGNLGRLLGDSVDGSFAVVSSPSIEDAEISAMIDDGESGEYWISSGSMLNFLDRKESLWKAPFDLSDEIQNPGSITDIIQDSDGWVWVGTTESGVHRLSNIDGSVIGSIQGLSSEYVTSMSYDESTNLLVIGHFESGVSLYSTTSNSVIEICTTSGCQYSGSQNGLDSNSIHDIATRYGTAYIATPDEGVMRIDLTVPEVIGSWQSLGVDNLESTPVAVDGDDIYLGLPGLGILIIDRLTNDIIDLWSSEDSNGIPDNDVNTLSIDYFGGLLVGSEVQNTGANSNGGLARWDGNGWELLPTSIPGWNNDPYEFYDVTSDSNGVYAGTNRGACMWNWPDPNDSQPQFTLEECWSAGGQGGGSGVPSRFVISVAPIGNDLLYAGTLEGAAVINTANGSVIDVWTAGDETERSRVVKIDDIVYMGFENLGITRFNLSSREWLPAWDGTQGIIEDDDITTLILGHEEGTIWAGGDDGLTLIDVVNESILIHWNLGTNENGPTLPTYAPQETIIIDDIMYYSPQRGWPWNSRDQVHRIDLTNNSSLTTIDAGEHLGFQGVIHGIGHIGNELWISVRETSGFGGGGDPGTIIRWNTTLNNWSDNLQTIGDVGRVNARYLGDCFPLNNSCELWVAYGDNILRRFSAENMTLLDQWDDVEGRIRGMVEFQGEYLFASMNGILRWNPSNETWLPSWLPDSGLPSESELDFYSMKVIGNDLWATSGDRNDGLVMRLSGSTGNWTTWEVDTSEIPDGYGADIAICDDIVHFAIGFAAWQWWLVGGGIARFDLADHDGNGITEEWITPLTEDNSDIVNNDPRALACDESNNILYIGFDEEDAGIDRFSYNSDDFIGALTPNSNGVSTEKVFPGGMVHEGNILLVSHYDGSGGITRVITSGASASEAQILSMGMDACSIERAPSEGSSVYAIGRSGDTSGINRIDRLDSTGLIEGGFDELVGLPSGVVHEMISNETHVWVTVGESEWSVYGSTILQGELLSNGSVNWQYGFDAIYETINEIMLIDQEVWLTTVGGGLWSVNLTDRVFSSTPAALHNQMDGIFVDEDRIIIGLMGYEGSSAGFQTFYPNSRSWGFGSLVAGLPSNIVTDFVEFEDHILIATHGGIGMWNTTRSDWDDPITTVDGLPYPIINHLFVPPVPAMGNGSVLIGGPNGITVLGANLTIIGTIGRENGLIGDAVAGIVYAGPSSRQVNDTSTGESSLLYHDAALFISHNGQGSTRPGVSAWDISTDRANGTYNIDMIPSNEVYSIATDDWGVHIATSLQPIVHWNGSSMMMEAGPASNELQAWPIIDLASDGTHLAAISPYQISIVESRGDHQVIATKQLSGALGGQAENGILIALAEDGLHVFQPMETLNEIPRESQRRANPLTAIFAERTVDITETTHPGMETFLVSKESIISIPTSQNQQNSSEILLFQGALTLTAPQRGAWIWARSKSLNYSGTWDLAALDSSIESAFQTAIFDTPPGSQSSVLNLQIQSPYDGKIMIRLTYDWERLEAPTLITDLSDRPDDGGGALQVSWLPAQDSAWAAYRLYVWDSTDDPSWTPSRDDLADFNSFIRVPYWSQTSALFTLGNRNGSEVQLSEDRLYRAAISIEYPDGTVGEPISWPENATPTDEVPSPPDWLRVEPIPGGNPGTLNAEWSACSELDPSLTRIWAVQQEINNALALPNPIDFPFAAGNSTALELEGNVPYWFAIVCVDESGQFDPANATVIGPIVTAGGLNDGISPDPVTGTSATDAPEDEGGRILVTWDPNQEEDCSYHIIYILPASGWTAPTTVDGWPIASYVPDCSTNEVVIDSIGNNSLEDGIVYWIGVVAVDDWGNQNVNDVLVVGTTSFPELDSTQWDAPDLVTGLQAWDHPDDDGSAIDVSWDRSTAPDFSHYTIWVSDYPLTDITEISTFCNESESCNQIVIDQRQIGNSPKLEISVHNALYGTKPSELTSSKIIPLIPLYVVVTIHDLAGNAMLSGLEEIVVLVTPMDNSGDITPPERISSPNLEDRSPDAGNGILVDFDLSDEPDIAEYWIFATMGAPFFSAENLEPALIVDRSTETPVLLEDTSNDEEITPGIPVWIAVVAVDSSGNAWLDNLHTSMISTVNEETLDPGLHLPEITGIIAYWEITGSSIEVLWDISEDSQVESYSVYISSTEFSNTEEAKLTSSDILISNETIFSIGPTTVNPSIHYWVAVVASDGENQRQLVNPIKVNPLSDYSFGESSPEGNQQSSSWFEQLIEGDLNMIIALVSSLMILLGAVLLIKPGDRTAPEPWEMGTREIEIEEELTREATGISEEEEIASASMGTQTSWQSDEIEKPEEPEPDFQPFEGEKTPQNVLAEDFSELVREESEEIGLDDLNEMADSLNPDSMVQEEIDFSFIDEALDED